jgi:uracil-DNA glycosylase
LAQLLTRFWKGHNIITLGTEAFHWFEPYVDKNDWKAWAATDARFDKVFTSRIPQPGTNSSHADAKVFSLRPLPHPSPLNRRWFDQFPIMLGRRLAEAGQTSPEESL